jgi:hypothetical protein
LIKRATQYLRLSIYIPTESTTLNNYDKTFLESVYNFTLIVSWKRMIAAYKSLLTSITTREAARLIILL